MKNKRDVKCLFFTCDNIVQMEEEDFITPTCPDCVAKSAGFKDYDSWREYWNRRMEASKEMFRRMNEE